MNARWRTAALALVLGYGAAACGSNPEGPIDETGYTGNVAARNRGLAQGAAFSNLYIRAAGDECGIVYSIDKETVLQRRTGANSVVEAHDDEFEVGSRVKAWSNGLIAESCPAQTHAVKIELLP